MKKNFFLILFVIVLSTVYSFNAILAQDNAIKYSATLNALFSIDLSGNQWIISKIDNAFFSLKNKDIRADGIVFSFIPKKNGVSEIVFVNLITNESKSVTIEIKSTVSSFSNVKTSSYNEIALFLYKNGIYDYAKNYFIKGKELASSKENQLDNFTFSFYVGMCSYYLKQYDQASSYLAISKLSGDDETAVLSNFYMGKIHMELKNYDIALDNFLFVIYKIDKDNELFDNTYYLLGLIYLKTKGYKEIISLIEPNMEYLKNSVFLYNFYYYLGKAYFEHKKSFKIALEYLNKITMENFEYYTDASEMKQLILTQYSDFH